MESREVFLHCPCGCCRLMAEAFLTGKNNRSTAPHFYFKFNLVRRRDLVDEFGGGVLRTGTDEPATHADLAITFADQADLEDRVISMFTQWLSSISPDISSISPDDCLSVKVTELCAFARTVAAATPPPSQVVFEVNALVATRESVGIEEEDLVFMRRYGLDGGDYESEEEDEDIMEDEDSVEDDDMGALVPMDQWPSRHKSPASKAAVDALEKTQFSGNQEKECVICAEDFSQHVRITHMPCRHIFHTQCLSTWLSENNTCPLCRFPLPR